MLVENLMRVWSEAEQEARLANGEKKMTSSEKKMVVAMVITMVILLAAYALALNQINAKDSLWQNIAFVAIGITAIALAVEGYILDKPKSSTDELRSLKERSEKTVSLFVDKTQVPLARLDEVRDLIASYIRQREERRKTVVARAFSVCISGILVTGLAFLFQHAGDVPLVSTASILLACMTSVVIALATGPIWDWVDARKKGSLLRARDMLDGLEWGHLFRLESKTGKEIRSTPGLQRRMRSSGHGSRFRS